MENIPIYKFKAFSFNDSVSALVQTCKQYDLTHIPVVEKYIYRGMIRCSDLLDIEDKNEKLINHTYLLEKIYLSDKANWTDTLRIMIQNQCNVIGILSLSGKYIGLQLLDDVLNLIANKTFISQQGYLLVISKLKSEISVSQIAQIIETNGGKILGLIINENQNNTQVEVKIQSKDINEIIQTFRRYDYQIISQMEEDLHLQELKEHSDFLKRYLEMGK